MRNIERRMMISMLTLLVWAAAISAQTGYLPADLDASFGGNGTGRVMLPNLSFPAQMESVFIKPNDEIISHGRSISHLSRANGAVRRTVYGNCYRPVAMAQFPNGYLMQLCNSVNYDRVELARFDPNLNIDLSFGSSGRVQVALGNLTGIRPWAVMIQNNRIVVTGEAVGSAGLRQQFVARFLSSGALDTSFNGTGFVLEKMGLSSVGYSLAPQLDNIVVGGGMIMTGNVDYSILTAYDPLGRRLTTFNGGNTIAIRGGGARVAAQPDLKILMTGPASGNKSQIYRFTKFGGIDGSFGQFGVATFPLGDSTTFHDIKIDPAGRIVLVGQWFDAVFFQATGAYRAGRLLVRYDQGGKLDGSFETPFYQPIEPGYRLLDLFGPEENYFTAIGFQSNGKLIVGALTYNRGAGTTSPPGYSSELFRFMGN
jgi:uncharacterized delta-60 repeat protein